MNLALDSQPMEMLGNVCSFESPSSWSLVVAVIENTESEIWVAVAISREGETRSSNALSGGL